MPTRRATRAVVLVAALLAVTLFIVACGGPTVPDVVGKNPAEAVRILQDAGYTLGNVSYGSVSNLPLGAVGKTIPAAGEKLREGNAVDIQINAHDGANAIVPNVIQQTLVTARTAVEQSSLTPVISYQYIDTVAKDIVITQSPTGGNKAGIGAPVILVISAGPAPAQTSMPDVAGKTEAEAVEAVESANLKPAIYDAFSDTVAKGKVIASIPEAGTKLTPGATVQVVVSQGKGVGTVKVPAVKGKREADASKAITSAGLKPTVFRQSSTTVASGVVINQFPTANSTAAAGSGVAIVVSTGKAPTTTAAIPNVTGMTQTQAEAALAGAGFAIEALPAAVDGPVGVIFQFPAAGTQADPGTPVLIIVNSGAPAAPDGGAGVQGAVPPGPEPVPPADDKTPPAKEPKPPADDNPAPDEDNPKP